MNYMNPEDPPLGDTPPEDTGDGQPPVKPPKKP